MKVLAAIDNSSASRPVLRAARTLAGLLAVDVEAVHVTEDGSRTARASALAEEVPLRLLRGDAASTLADALEDPDVLVLSLGTRAHPGGARPAGHVVRTVMEKATKALLLVPPCEAPERIGRVLMPLDGTSDEAHALRDVVRLLASAGASIVAVHVFDARTAPRFWDRPQRDQEAWTREFLARHCEEPGVRLELRVGSPQTHVQRVAEAEHADLVVMAWSRRLGEGRARVVTQMLAETCVPLLLLPREGVRNGSGGPAARAGSDRGRS